MSEYPPSPTQPLRKVSRSYRTKVKPTSYVPAADAPASSAEEETKTTVRAAARATTSVHGTSTATCRRNQDPRASPRGSASEEFASEGAACSRSVTELVS